MDATAPVPVDTGLADRLAAATVAHRDAQEVAARAAKTWRELVVDCYDAGMGYAEITRLAGISRARVHAIVVGESLRT